jgi:hypothetical protein
MLFIFAFEILVVYRINFEASTMKTFLNFMFLTKDIINIGLILYFKKYRFEVHNLIDFVLFSFETFLDTSILLTLHKIVSVRLYYFHILYKNN